MDISSVNSDLIRGNVTTIILGSLWNRDRYGYDILKEIEVKSEGQYKLKQPTLYNQLKRLEKQGLISSYDGDPDDTGGGRRRYYSLTAEGRSFLEKERSEYEYSRTILDKLVSNRQFDFDTTPAPFNTDDLRPYIKKDNSDKAKVVYREKEKVVLVEKKIYIDADGNEISEEEAQRLAAEGGKQAVGISQEEFERIQAEKQAEIERIEEQNRAELERLEEEKRAELEKLAEEKQAELNKLEEEKQSALERLQEEKRIQLELAELAKREELERIEEEKRIQLERAEEEKRAELERAEEEKRAELERAEEAKREELNRLAEEARAERERLEAEHAEEIEKLRAEKLAAEEAYAEKEAEYSARRIEELERIAAEREETERRFREEYEKFETEKRAEEERRAEAERIEEERRAELQRIEAERIEAEERFRREREEFLAEKAEEEERRAAFERAENERREKAEREAREREEALRSQATMSLADVFKELDSRSEYAVAAPADDIYIVEHAKWQVEEPLPSEIVEAKEEAPEQIPEEEAAADAEPIAEKTEAAATEEPPAQEESQEPSSQVADDSVKDKAATMQESVTLADIFRILDSQSDYSSEKSEDEGYDIDGAEWQFVEAESQWVHVEDKTSEDTAPAPEEKAEETQPSDNGDERESEDERIEELVRLEAERKAELERIAREIEAVKAKLDYVPAFVYRGSAVSSQHTDDVAEKETTVEERTAGERTALKEESSDETQHEEINYFSADNSYGTSRQAPESTLSDVFRMLDEKEAEIDAKKSEENRADDYAQQSAAADYAESTTDFAQPLTEEEKGEFVVSAVRSKRTEAFDYEKGNVNYREFFSSIADKQEEKAEEPPAERTLPRPETDLKTRLYSEGFKMRPYDRGNTSEYYTFNFINANRLNRDSWLIVLAIYLVETAIMWACLAKTISYIYFLPFMAGGTLLMLIPTFVWMANPSRRKRADFNVKLSVLNRGMMLIELAVVLVLIAFFGVGVSVNDTTLILETMVLPIILLTNLPVSSIVYWLLYRSKKYHTA